MPVALVLTPPRLPKGCSIKWSPPKSVVGLNSIAGGVVLTLCPHMWSQRGSWVFAGVFRIACRSMAPHVSVALALPDGKG